MRLLRLLFCIVLLGVLGALSLLVLAQNWHTTQVSFFGLQYDIHLAWVLVGAAAFGVVFTLVLLLPGRFAAMLHTWSLERELRQWEQDLWKLQEQREHLLARHEHLLEAHQHLLARHERLLEAHERVVQVHHRLVGEHSQAIAERDQARVQVAARTAPAYQPARQPSMPRIADVSPGASGAATRTPAASRRHAHNMYGGRGSTPAPRSPRRAAPWPTAPTAVRTVHASLQVAAGDDDRGARKARDTTPLGNQPLVLQPPLAPVGVGLARDVPTRDGPPAPASEPLPPAVGEPALPQTVPVLSTERAAFAPVAPTAAPPATPPLFSQFLLRSLQRTAERASVSLAPSLASLRRWRDTDGAGMVAALMAKRDIFEARLAHLKQSLFSGALPLDPSRTIPSDLPSEDDER